MHLCCTSHVAGLPAIDDQLSFKRFMIVTVTSLESNVLQLADFESITILIGLYNQRPSPVKWRLLMFLMKFWQQLCVFL